MYRVSKSELTLIFFVMIFFTSGGFFSFDFPQLFEDEIIKEFDVTSVQVQFLYTMYALPNFIALFFGTFAFNYIGLALGICFTTAFITLGTLTTFLAFTTNSFVLLAISRGIYGLGNELAITAQFTIAERWFAGKMLSFAQGMCRSVSFLVTFLSFYIGPQMLIRTKSMDLSLTIYCLMGGFGMLTAIFYTFLEKIWGNRQKRQDLEKEKEEELKRLAQENENEEEKVPEGEEEENETEKRITTTTATSETYKEGKFTLGMVRHLGLLYYLLIITFGLGSMCYLIFISFSTDCLVHRFGYTYEDAKNKLSVLSIISMVSMPILSFFIGKYGKKGWVLLLAFLLSALNFTLMLSFPREPGNYVYCIVVLTSLMDSVFVAVIWPCMTLSVPPKATAIALGLGLTMQNICNSTLPTYFGIITKPRTAEAYNIALISLLVVSLVSCLLSILVIIVDCRTGQLLNLPENDPRVTKMREKIALKFEDIINKNRSIKDSKVDYRSIGQQSSKTGKTTETA